MLQSFALQNSSLNFKKTKHENAAHFINVKGTLVRANEFKLKNLCINLRIFKVCISLFSRFIKTFGRKMSLSMTHRDQVNQFASALKFS